MRPLQKIIDREALWHNWQVIGSTAPHAKRVAVVKADAYGHGVQNLLPVLLKLPCFAVACIEEALALRKLGLQQPVWLLEGVFQADEFAECAAQGFIPWLHNHEQLAWLAALTKPLPFWLKMDSGMHRLGFVEKEISAVIGQVTHLPCQGIASHFACADEEDLSHTQRQFAAFNRIVLPKGWQRSLANSAGIFALREAHFDWVRPGLSLYGMSPFAHKSATALGLRPVMTLQTEILACRYLDAGESAGYGCGFVAQEAGYLATIALGYGDGFARHIDSGKMSVQIDGRLYSLVGRVAMDMCLVWLGKVALPIGSRVVIFGDGHAVETVAAQTDTIPYTLTTMLTARVNVQIKN